MRYGLYQNTIPLEVLDFRDQYRAKEVGRYYRGWLHLAFTTISCFSLILGSLAQLRAPVWYEYLSIPLFFLIANAGEYLGHRGPMHHLRTPLRALFHLHTQTHHRFFTNEAMGFEGPRDYKAVLFPPLMLLVFFGAVVAPPALLFSLWVSQNVGFLFVATVVGYFLMYEWVHFGCHLPETSWVLRIPGMRRLQRQHRLHHDPLRMTRANFNIAFPISDALFGTLSQANE